MREKPTRHFVEPLVLSYEQLAVYAFSHGNRPVVNAGYVMADFGYAELLDAHELLTAFTFGGATYYGVAGDRSLGRAVDFGGFAGDADQILVCSTAQFTTRPVAQNTVTLSGKELRVGSVTTSPDDTFLVLHLVDPARGA